MSAAQQRSSHLLQSSRDFGSVLLILPLSDIDSVLVDLRSVKHIKCIGLTFRAMQLCNIEMRISVFERIGKLEELDTSSI